MYMPCNSTPMVPTRSDRKRDYQDWNGEEFQEETNKRGFKGRYVPMWGKGLEKWKQNYNNCTWEIATNIKLQL